MAGVLASITLAVVAPLSASATAIVGDSTVEATVASQNAGTADSFNFTASATGTLTSLSMYLDATATATSVVVGIYSNSGSHPGTLLAKTTISSPTKGAWNTGSISGVSVTSGTVYWIAVLAPSGAGTLKYREKPSQNLSSEVSASATLSTLPSSWTAGSGDKKGPGSVYGSTSGGATAPGAPTIGTATGGNAQATVTFTAPGSNGGSTITGYTVTSSPAGGTDSNAGTTGLSHVVTGLNNGTAYTFTVTATNAIGTGPASAASNSVTPATVPGAPTIGTASAGNAQATVTFSAPSSSGGSVITGYTVISSPAGGTDSNAGTTNLSHVITGLANGTAYTFTVKASNAIGTGAASAPSNSVTPVATTVPGAPTIGTATAGNSQATVTFTAPASNGGSTITGYTVTSSPTGGSDSNAGTTGLTHVITGLTNGTAYAFTVTATNAVGKGAASAASNSVTPATVPGAPSIGTATGGNAQATVTFTAPASNGGSAISGYTVTSSPAGGTDTDAGTTALSHVVTGLTNGTAYTFTVKASNAVGAGAASAASNSVTPAATTVPGAPIIGTATAGNAQATVKFTAPASNGGSTVTGYIVTSSPAGGTDSGTGTTSLSHVITGLTNGTAYTFTVTATNAIGTSPASAASNSVTPATVPGAPTIGTGSPGNAQVTVTFTAPVSNGGSAITGYSVTSSPAGGTDSNAGTTGLSHIITGLTNGTAYTFTVTATNAIGTGSASAASASVIPRTVPGAPTIGTATAGNAQATVPFTAPASNGGSAITGYTVTSSPAGGSDSNAGTTGLSHVMTGLTNGTAYTFTVTATNIAGTGSASAASNSVTPATVPGAPTIGTATAGNAQATVTFTAPASNGGSAITGYTVTSSPAGGTDSNAGTTGLSHVMTGLTNGTAYAFTVKASNAIGSSVASGASNSVTPAATTAPGAPTIGVAIGGNAQATVTFTAPASNGGSAITGYTVTSNPAGGADSNAGTTALTHVVTGLTNGTAYTFTVKATNAAGTGTASAVSNSVTPVGTVAVPNVVGTSQSAASTSISAASLAVGTVTQANSATVASGNVISESPAAGTVVNKGSAVNLVVSIGPLMVSVPNVVGQSQAAAGSSLTAAGLATGTVTMASSATVAAGAVISESPIAGTSVAQGTAVSLVVSSGPPSGTMVAPTLGSFTPTAGATGTVITLSGNNFVQSGATAAVVTLAQQGSGTLTAPVVSATNTSLSFLIPPGAASGVISVAVGTQSSATTSALTVTPASSFTLSAAPASANLIQGQSVTYQLNLASTNGYTGLAALSISGVPSGVTATFKPTQITAGQHAVLTLTAPGGQATGTSALTVTAQSTINGMTLTQTAGLSLSVQSPTTTFLGRTVVQDTLETPLAGVTISFLGQDGAGHTTICTGSGVSDAGGNFAIPNLPVTCLGPQLIRYNGATASIPVGSYAGVDLLYTFVAGQVTTPPVLIHLPKLDGAETKMVTQNATVDQNFVFSSIPGLSLTIYAGTTLTLPDGTTPNPFPLVAVQVPVDRLPDQMAMSSATVTHFIVAFQPEGTLSSRPIAVTFPNTDNTAPNTVVELDTLNPTKGVMVKYGTATVSADGLRLVPDLDPAYPGARYGLIHFDWHGPQAPAPGSNPPCNCQAAGPGATGSGDSGDGEDPGSGNATGGSGSGEGGEGGSDIGGSAGSDGPSITRSWASFNTNPGTFGIGSYSQYDYVLDVSGLVRGTSSVINLAQPDSRQIPFASQGNGSYANTVSPSHLGAVLSAIGGGQYLLRWKNGSSQTYQTPAGGALAAYLVAMTDTSGNTTQIIRGNASQPTQVTQVINPYGRALSLTYDGSNRVTAITDALNHSVTYTYNTQGKLATFTNAAGGMTQFAYDSSNRPSAVTDQSNVVRRQWFYDANGRVSKAIAADGGVVTYSYTLSNPAAALSPVLQTVKTDSLGRTTTYHFNPQGYPIDVTDATGQTRTFVRDPGNQLLMGESGLGFCSGCGATQSGALSYTYDSLGNRVTATDGLGNTTQYKYDPVYNKTASITDPLGNITNFAYDGNGNLISITDPLGNVTSMTYTARGKLASRTDPLGNTTKWQYDSFGNAVSMSDALGNTTQTVYDALGRPIETIDPAGRTTKTSYDALGRVIAVTDPSSHTVTYGYDAIGNLTSVTDEQGHTTTYAYTASNQLVSRIAPSGRKDTRSYDTAGQLTQYTDFRGEVANFGYDALGRLISEQYGDASTVQRTYDSNGRLARAVDSLSGTFEYGYDAAGRLTQTADPTGAVQYAYDAASRLASRQVVGQPAVSYGYDARSLLTQATFGTNPVASVALAYDAAGSLTSLSRGNNVISTYSYDGDRRLSTLSHALNTTVLGGQSFTYDAVGQRTTASNSFAQALVTAAATNAYNVDNQLTGTAGTTYGYDSNGNQTSVTTTAGTTTYSWDGRNRLSTITSPSGALTRFTYDPGRNLIGITKPAGAATTTQRFLLDSLTNVVYVSGSDGTILNMLTGLGLDSHFATVDGTGQVRYLLSDAINSVAATTDQAGTIRTQAYYEPYGLTTEINGQTLLEYTGRLPVGQNLYYNRARYYDASIARFVSEDPIGMGGSGTNYYAYVGNSPLNFVDPLGLLRWNNPPPQTVPVTGATANELSCLEACEKRKTGNDTLDLLMTGGAETSGHTKNSRHYKGEACDVAAPKFNPGVTDSDIKECARACGFGAGWWEPAPGKPNKDHWHFQLTPGNGVPSLGPDETQ